MNNLTLDQLLTDFFKETDTITISAQELQSLLIKSDRKLREQELKISKLKQCITNLEINRDLLNNKINNLQIKQQSNFILDLKA